MEFQTEVTEPMYLTNNGLMLGLHVAVMLSMGIHVVFSMVGTFKILVRSQQSFLDSQLRVMKLCVQHSLLLRLLLLIQQPYLLT